MATLGGPALPVVVQNGGEQQGGAAIPIMVVSDGRATQGGPATPIYIATGGPQQGGPALPVVAAPYGQRIAGGDAVPAYIVGGGYLPSVYESKVIAMGPIAFWPLDEASGATAFDRSGNGRNATYTNVTLGATGIGDGGTAASFNGTTAFTNIYSAAFQAAFNQQELSISFWINITPAVWTDATLRAALRIRKAGALDRIDIYKNTPNNEFDVTYVANGVTKNVVFTFGASPTRYIHACATVSLSGDALKFYINGAQVGTTQSGLGTWTATTLDTNQCIVGALSGVPSNATSGLIAQVAIWNRPLSPAEVASLAVLT